MYAHPPPAYTAPIGQYKDYYTKSQYGHGLLPAYMGARRQRGHGIGSFLGNVFRTALPLLKTVGKAVGKKALTTGAHVLSDVASGENIKSSLIKRSKQSGNELLRMGVSSAKDKAKEYLTQRVRRKGTKRGASTKGKGRPAKRAKSTLF